MALVALNTALKTFSVCSTTLFVKFFATVSIQGGKSFAAGARPPEDNSFNKSGKLPNQTYGLTGTEESGEDSEKLKQARAIDYRWKRIVQNDLETIPIGLAVFLGSVLVGGHEATNCALMGTFTAARIAHTFAYANELQPHRAIFWSAGQLCVLASGLNGVISFII
ncbi:Gtp-binding protein parf, partial [Globisporangium splendens]